MKCTCIVLSHFVINPMASLEYIKVRNNMSYTIIPILMKKNSEKRIWLTEEKILLNLEGNFTRFCHLRSSKTEKFECYIMN